MKTFKSVVPVDIMGVRLNAVGEGGSTSDTDVPKSPAVAPSQPEKCALS